MIALLVTPWNRESYKWKVWPNILAFDCQPDSINLANLEKSSNVELPGFLSYRIFVDATMLAAHSKPVEKCQCLEFK